MDKDKIIAIIEKHLQDAEDWFDRNGYNALMRLLNEIEELEG